MAAPSPLRHQLHTLSNTPKLYRSQVLSGSGWSCVAYWGDIGPDVSNASDTSELLTYNEICQYIFRTN